MRADKLFSPFAFERSRGALSVYDLNIKDIVTAPEDADAATVYVCLRTPLGDGHRGAAEAYARGCRCFLAARGLGLPEDAAVYLAKDPEAHLGELAARCFGYPARSLTVFGITGTHGKTSVVDTASAVLRRAGKRVATLTTDGFALGDTFRTSSHIPPNAADIQRFLRAARRDKAEFVFLEFSAYMLAHHAEKSIPFAAVLLTDLTSSCVGEGMWRDFESYRATKAKLLSCGAPLTVLPEELSYLSATGRALTVGHTGDIGVENVRIGEREGQLGTAFSLTFEGQTAYAFYGNVGMGAAQNAAAATALALAAGLSLAEIAAALPFSAPVCRLECVYTKDGARIFLDAAYQARDLTYALSSLRRVTTGKLSVVLGSVGGRALARRAPLGRTAALEADFVYFTADDPDSEPVLQIARDMVAEIEDSRRYLVVPSRREAILRAVGDLRRGDTLLVLGKARDDTQLVMGAREPFSDRDMIVNAARRR